MRNDTFTTSVDTVAKRFFAFNFPSGSFGTLPFTPAVSRPSTGIIQVTASAQLPTTMMQFFGLQKIPLNVSCNASLNFVNTDVVLVLDTTGSMADPVNGTAKIQTLRSAVLALYDELAPIQQQLEAQGLRLRYGIVPYSSTVNVGRMIYNASPGYLRDSTPYTSRVANYNTPVYVANAPTSTSSWEYYNGVNGAGVAAPTSFTLSNNSCQSWVQSAAMNAGGPAPTATTQTTYMGSDTSSTYVAAQDWGWTGAPVTTGTNRSCRRWRTVSTTTYTTRYSFTNWTYRQVTYDTSRFKVPGALVTISTDGLGTVATSGSFNALQLPLVATGAGTKTVGWNGCIEERDTTSSIDGGTSLAIPTAAFDLDINLIPSGEATRWRPMWPDLIYLRNAGTTSGTATGSTSTTNWIQNNAYSTGYWSCPNEARRLAPIDRSSLESYVATLQPNGGTYHDIGMLWGARLISSGGIFADGCDNYNGMPCNRHIIFITDGLQTAYCNVLTAYGVEQNDLRVTGSGTCPNQLSRHEQRFRMICNAAKSMNVSVWVIGFDTALNSNLSGCASNANQASTSADSASLIARFRQIGNQIGALRLVK